MAVVQSPEKHDLQEDAGKYQVTPRYGAWLEEDRFVVEVALPGVPKESISMKALQDYFSLRASRENIEYVLDLDLNFKIEPGKVTSDYLEGLLRVEFQRYDPLAHAHVLMARKKALSDNGDEVQEEKPRYRVFPAIYRHTDTSTKTITIEISIPGVKQENIDLKIMPTWLFLSAGREDMEYRANASFGAEIVPEKTTTEYNKGLLKIKAEIRDPMDNAKDVVL